MEIINDFSTSVKKALEEIDPNYMEYVGLVVCGTHAPHDVEQILEKIKHVRESGTPFLGICAGNQFAWIEYWRNVLGIKDATSEEFGQGVFVVKKRHNLLVGLHDGETYWSNYQCVIPSEGWPMKENFISVPFHPEYQSSKDKPHPLLQKFLNYAKMSS